MNFDWKRWKIFDYVVMALFVLAVIGAALAWWSPDMPDLGDALSSELGDLGIATGDLEGLGLNLDELLAEELAGPAGFDMGLDVTELDSVVFCLIFALIAVLVVLGKAFFPVGKELPRWYMEALAIMACGAMITIITFFRLVVAPEGGHSYWKPGAGGFLMLIAGLALLGVGYMMFRDKAGDYGKSVLPKMPKITTNTGAPVPPAGGASKFCVGCGSQLDPGAAACKNCGRAV